MRSVASRIVVYLHCALCVALMFALCVTIHGVVFAVSKGWSLSSVVRDALDRLPSAVVTLEPYQFRQRSANSCGAAALAFALHYVGFYSSEESVLISIAKDADDALSLSDVKVAAECAGLRATGKRGNWTDLQNDVELPAIVHYSFSHFVVVISLDASSVAIMDPGDGRVKFLPKERFEKHWSGAYLKLSSLSHSQVATVAEGLQNGSCFR